VLEVLLAMLGFGDDSPDLHAHFTRHMRALEESDPVEFARTLRVLEEALSEYAARLYAARQMIEQTLTAAAEHKAASGG
jgi:recombinational DNA repair ATPase RecF